ncbi:hypothetical protein GFS60_01109 [Rhodococcus sp. WAY2]|nr:hypothetical protein GFS60_01109 [Rhodococcus sp. WAY2]
MRRGGAQAGGRTGDENYLVSQTLHEDLLGDVVPWTSGEIRGDGGCEFEASASFIDNAACPGDSTEVLIGGTAPDAQR